MLFRFCVIYFALYALATPLAGGVLLLPGRSLPPLGHVWPAREVTAWLAERLLGVTTPLVYAGNSGDTLFHWIQTAWLIPLAAVVAGIWHTVRRRPAHETALHGWFAIAVRFVLAGQMFYYGMAKVVPTQFQAPSLVTLVEPVGHLSRSDLLWTFIGASAPYQVLAGVAEVGAGLLLVVPRTATLGAIVCLADMIQVFALNMAYDFGLKQIALHLILFCLALLVTDLPALRDLLLRRRPAQLPPPPALFTTPRANRLAAFAQIVFGLYLLATFSVLSVRLYYQTGDGSPRSPLYGIWDVQELSLDGTVVSPAQADYDRRWRRVIFDTPDVLVFQRTDDSFAHYGVRIDEANRRVALSKGRSRTWAAAFSYERPSADRLVLTGGMDGHQVQARLTLVALDTFRLRGSRFRWIRPPDPFAG